VVSALVHVEHAGAGIDLLNLSRSPARPAADARSVLENQQGSRPLPASLTRRLPELRFAVHAVYQCRQRLQRKSSQISSSVTIVCMTGTGSASPVVSTMTRSTRVSPRGIVSHGLRKKSRPDRLSARSKDIVVEQHHVLARHGDEQMVDAISPNSLMITRHFAIAGSCKQVIQQGRLPLPRKR